MITTINEYDFLQAFKSVRPDNFTKAGLSALYNYLEDLGEATGQQVELDVVALCCEYAEYENLKEFRNDYGKWYETMEDVAHSTELIMIDEDSFIVQQF